MRATDFDGLTCRLGKQPRRVTYHTLLRDYRCAVCGSRLAERFVAGAWIVDCPRHGANFVHVRQVEREEAEALEMLDGMPTELQALYDIRPKSKLSLDEANKLLHPKPLDI